MKPKWAISVEIFRKPGSPQLDAALKRAGIEYFESELNQETREYADIPYGTDECVILYGPIRFVRTKDKGYLPGGFGFKKDTDTSYYMSQLPRDLFFNSDAIYLPFGMIAERKDMLQDLFGDRIFIRPDSGFKSFTGFDVNMKDLDLELSSLKQTKNPGAHEMCLVAKSKTIGAEYRLVVCEGQVITGSQYRWDGRMDVRIDIHNNAWTFAQNEVAKHPWQLDTCYVVDIFLDENMEPKIGEFNSFASAGLYHCDMDKIVDAVSSAALREWNH